MFDFPFFPFIDLFFMTAFFIGLKILIHKFFDLMEFSILIFN